CPPRSERLVDSEIPHELLIRAEVCDPKLLAHDASDGGLDAAPTPSFRWSLEDRLARHKIPSCATHGRDERRPAAVHSQVMLEGTPLVRRGCLILAPPGL